MNDSPALAALRREIDCAPVEALESVVAALEGLKARAYMRMMVATVAPTICRTTDDGSDQDAYLTTAELAARLHVSTRMARKLARKIGCVNVGRNVRIPRENFERYESRLRRGQNP